jgi:hypothetical protein
MSEAVCCAACVVLVALVIAVWALFVYEPEEEPVSGSSSSGAGDDGDEWQQVTAEDVAIDPATVLPLPDGSEATEDSCAALAQNLAAGAPAGPEVGWCEDDWIPAAALCASHAVAFSAGDASMTSRCISAAAAESHEEVVSITAMHKWSREQPPRLDPLDCSADVLSPAIVYAGAAKRVVEAWLEIDDNWFWDSDSELLELHSSLAELYGSSPNATAVFTCPVGCRRISPTECSPCPAVFDACGEFGGCDPRDRSAANATEDTMQCVCVEGFTGRVCDMKTEFGGIGIFVAIIGLPCVFAVGCAMFVASRGSSADAEGDDDDANIGVFQPREKRVPGPVGQEGKDEMKEILLRALQYLQLSAAAFSVNVPWSLEYNFAQFLDFWAIDFEVVVPDMDYMLWSFVSGAPASQPACLPACLPACRASLSFWLGLSICLSTWLSVCLV